MVAGERIDPRDVLPAKGRWDRCRDAVEIHDLCSVSPQAGGRILAGSATLMAGPGGERGSTVAAVQGSHAIPLPVTGRPTASRANIFWAAPFVSNVVGT